MQRPLYNRVIFVFSLVGLLIAGALWNWHSHPQDIPCGISHGCEDVANSIYSRLPVGTGPPIAMYGTLGYLAILILSLLRAAQSSVAPSARDRVLRGLITLGALFGTAFSLRLTYMEISPDYIHAICKWCMASQAIILLLLGLSIADIVSARRNTTSTGGAQ